MALIKEITLNSGITINYHRIVSVNNITNISSIIEVGSYVNRAKRQEEKSKTPKGEEMDIFISTEYFPLPYDEKIDVVKAYDYLKKTEKFSGSKDD